MTDATPSPEAAGRTVGAPAPAAWGGAVPERAAGPFYSTGLVILLTIVTLGIWQYFWTYRTSEDLKAHNGDGLGGLLGLLLVFFVYPVVMFTIPNEIKNAYERDGRESPVSALWGLWFLLPLIGNLIWYVKVQSALNDFWVSKGARQD
jgi:Domain of unknown function (DUF4234)